MANHFGKTLHKVTEKVSQFRRNVLQEDYREAELSEYQEVRQMDAERQSDAMFHGFRMQQDMAANYGYATIGDMLDSKHGLTALREMAGYRDNMLSLDTVMGKQKVMGYDVVFQNGTMKVGNDSLWNTDAAYVFMALDKNNEPMFFQGCDARYNQVLEQSGQAKINRIGKAYFPDGAPIMSGNAFLNYGEEEHTEIALRPITKKEYMDIAPVNQADIQEDVNRMLQGNIPEGGVMPVSIQPQVVPSKFAYLTAANTVDKLRENGVVSLGDSDNRIMNRSYEDSALYTSVPFQSHTEVISNIREHILSYEDDSRNAESFWNRGRERKIDFREHDTVERSAPDAAFDREPNFVKRISAETKELKQTDDVANPLMRVLASRGITFSPSVESRGVPNDLLSIQDEEDSDDDDFSF